MFRYKSQKLLRNLPELLLLLARRLVDQGEEVGVLLNALVQPGHLPRDKLQGGILHPGVEGRGGGGVVGCYIVSEACSPHSGHSSLYFPQRKHGDGLKNNVSKQLNIQNSRV